MFASRLRRTSKPSSTATGRPHLNATKERRQFIRETSTRHRQSRSICLSLMRAVGRRLRGNGRVQPMWVRSPMIPTPARRDRPEGIIATLSRFMCSQCAPTLRPTMVRDGTRRHGTERGSTCFQGRNRPQSLPVLVLSEPEDAVRVPTPLSVCEGSKQGLRTTLAPRSTH